MEQISKQLFVAIVDDDKAVREATSTLLRSLGYAVRSFASADEFLRTDSAAHSGCLITDLSMPGLTGLELQSELVSLGFNVPVIFVTGFANESSRIQAFANGAVAFFSKPFSEDLLADCLARVFPAPANEPNTRSL
jgi:FixJ family two-component response regulator